MKKLVLLMVLLLMIPLCFSAIGDPTKFGNSTHVTVTIGGSDGIGNFSGDVMIGTNNPTQRLTVNGSANVTYGNLTVQDGYFYGQPLLGMLGSGIIHSEQANHLSEVNVTCSGLTCSYNNFVVRLVSGTSDQFSKYCNIPTGSKTATNNAHNVFYVDNNCVVQVTSIETWFDTLIANSGQWDFANMMCYDNSCEVINGISLEQRRMMKQRVINFNKNHLSITSGFGKTTSTFPNWTLASGEYIYLMDVVTASAVSVGTTNSIEVIVPNGTGWIHRDQNVFNYTSCTNGTAAVTCTNINRWRRVFFFMVGWNDTTDSSGLHQLLPLQDTSYTTEVACLDTTVSPLTYTLPDYYQRVMVPVWAYCVRASDNSWSSTGWIDLRTVKVGSVTGVSTADFVPYSGASQNVDLGSYNLTATGLSGIINAGNISTGEIGLARLPYISASAGWSNSTTMISTALVTNVTNNLWFNNSLVCTASNGLCNASFSGYATLADTATNLGNWSSDKANYLNNTQGYVTLANTVVNIGNWSSDRNNYVNFTVLNAQNNLSLSQIVANIGNWSNEKANYALTTYVNSLGNWSAAQTSLPNLTYAQIVANIGNWSDDKASYTLKTYVDSLGNWSDDKSDYALTTYVDSIGNWSAGQTSLLNLTYAQINTNMGNWSSDRPNYLNRTGFDAGNLTTGQVAAARLPYLSSAAGWTNTTSIINTSLGLGIQNTTLPSGFVVSYNSSCGFVVFNTTGGGVLAVC